ncbi:transcriptional regulator with XRE-family HTH domain [Hamadaea flava]|uniref:Helix-turn-helix domain-containing protein n=1 Tax=Hamadaea flava TaxID=1742688 RepID=A0ABV8LJZ5_9ACTN|nr:helix-turn-helix transcriptional regulator [Hamadaea flava]MCP2323749.1 transcriptional regulator with XRE-family HTH domain [Hamadaea flava]
MRNERLREAIRASGLAITELGGAVGVNGKTAQRWVYEGRTPRRKTADRVSRRLGVPVDWLWPTITGPDAGPDNQPRDFVRLYAHRGEAPRQLWHELMRGAKSSIDILCVTGLFLAEDNPSVDDLLARKAEDGVPIRLAMAHPASPALRRRAAEQRLVGALAARARAAISYFEPIGAIPGAQLRTHSLTAYSSIFRFDDDLLLNQHLFGVQNFLSPLMHLRRETEGGLFDLVTDAFDRFWVATMPIGPD